MQRFIYSFSKAFHKQILLSLMLALITYVPLAAHTRVLKLFHAFSHILKLFAYFHAFPASYKIVVYCIQGFFFYTVCKCVCFVVAAFLAEKSASRPPKILQLQIWRSHKRCCFALLSNCKCASWRAFASNCV